MRIAILSDFHLGYERFREDAFKQAKEALESAASEADILLIPGDIFDNRNPKPDVLAEAINLFRELSRRDWKARATVSKGAKAYADVPIIAIPGTHERRAQDDEDPVDLLHLAGLLIDVSDATAIVEKGGEKIAVCGLGGISEERFRDIVREKAPKPTDGAFNVLMFHQSVYELLPFSKDFISLDEFPKGFDLYVNGHIHSRYEGRIHGSPFLIPGSTVLTQLKDNEQERKGFYIYDTKTREASFREISCREFIVAKIDMNGRKPGEIAESVEGTISNIISKGSVKPVVRIVLEGRMDDGFKRMDMKLHAIAKKFKDRAIVEISDKGTDGAEIQIEGARRMNASESISVKDLGMSIFMEKLQQKKYGLKTNPSELFEALSGDESKEKIVKRTIEKLLEDL
ncbi:MAG: DNA repair exonuclease [Candidatus Micrarchaeota archaeon]|nr:DNA repair exonuclease [Candidatus Micrarchaeota archaeon]